MTRTLSITSLLLFVAASGGVAWAEPEDQKKRVAFVKVSGPKKALKRAVYYLEQEVEDKVILVDGGAFFEAAEKLDVADKPWKPGNLKQIARKIRVHAVIALMVKGKHLQLGVIDGSSGKMKKKIRLFFKAARFRKKAKRRFGNFFKKALKRIDYIEFPRPRPLRPRRPPPARRPPPSRFSPAKPGPLLVTGKLEGSLHPGSVKRLLSAMGWERFNRAVSAKRMNDPKIIAWCRHAAGLPAEGELEQPKRLLRRCAEVYSLAVDVRHKCRGRRKRSSCRLEGSLVISRYRGVIARGALLFSQDEDFGEDGKVTVEATATGRAADAPDSDLRGRAAALKAAIGKLAAALGKKLGGIPEFRLSTRILRRRGHYASLCLDKRRVKVDTPFEILARKNGELKRVGLVRAETIYKRCRLKAGGRRRYSGRPLKARVILGGDAVAKGQLARELPSIGLSVGLNAGLSSSLGFFAGNVAVGPGLQLAYNLGPASGISQLHFFVNASFGATTKPGAAGEVIANSDLGPWRFVSSGVGFAFGLDLGVLKRISVGGPLFIEVGGGLSASFLGVTPDEGGVTATVGGIGGVGLFGFGAQLAANWLLSLQVGYRALATIASVQGGVNCDAVGLTCGTKLVGAEHGPVARIGIHFSY